MGHFLPFPSLKTTKIIILKKWKNLLKILSFYKCVPKTSIIWGTVLKIQSETQNFLSFWAIFTLLHSYQSRKSKFWKNKKSIWRCCHFLYTCIPKITITWCMLPEIWSVRDIIFCHFGPFFCPLTPLPPNNLENQNFEKLKKARRYHHFTQVFQKSWSYLQFLRYGAQQISYLSFWAIFCPSAFKLLF